MRVAGIAAKNEGKTIAKVVRELLKYVDEVIVVDDGSNDNTYEEAKGAGAKVFRTKGVGKGMAVKLIAREFLNTGGRLLLIDGDMQHPPHMAPKAFEMLDRYDLVVGCRVVSDRPAYRTLGDKISDLITSIFALNPRLMFFDTQSGFRALREEAVRLLLELKEPGYGHESEVLIRASRKGFRIGCLKIPSTYKVPNPHKYSPVPQFVEIIRGCVLAML